LVVPERPTEPKTYYYKSVSQGIKTDTTAGENDRLWKSNPRSKGLRRDKRLVLEDFGIRESKGILIN